jgi:hypothetical protein
MFGADTGRMNRTYELGPARDLDRERPSVMELQRAQARAVRAGDLRRAAAYALVIARRVRIAQRRAA